MGVGIFICVCVRDWVGRGVGWYVCVCVELERVKRGVFGCLRG